MDDFSNQGRFFNRQIVSDFIHKNVTYNSYMHGTPGTQTGRAIGKTRYFYTSSNSITLPSNHYRNFGHPFVDTMWNGAQNTKPGILPLKTQEDYVPIMNIHNSSDKVLKFMSNKKILEFIEKV